MIEVSTRADRTEFYNSSDWRELRKLALERDHYECVWCRDEGRVTMDNLEVDHIKELEFYPEFALDDTIDFNSANLPEWKIKISERMSGGGENCLTKKF